MERTTVEVRIRLGSGIARFAPAPLMTLHLPEGATVADACDELAAASDPDLTQALRTALPIVRGVHAERNQELTSGDELALLAPISGG